MGGKTMDNLTIVNYQGSKKNLLEFIHEKMDKYITPEDVILDIFSGTASVAYSYKRTNTVYANDAELYATTIARALLGKKIDMKNFDKIQSAYSKYSYPVCDYNQWIAEEQRSLNDEDLEALISLYNQIPTVWKNGKKCFADLSEYSLFVKYYSTSYFGVEQAKDIDAIRFAISFVAEEDRDIFYACLFYAMKECVFSKDGHMAQPLDLAKNATRLFKLRKKSIYEFFCDKIAEFNSDEFVCCDNDNMIFNTNFETLLENPDMEPVSVIYADPPYTDMQYSRYYHLLNTVVQYDYPDLTENNGQYTKGLYLDNRFQSQLSKKSTCLSSMELLIKYSAEHGITLAISFAYPVDTEHQKTDRYVMDIADLISSCRKFYPEENVHVEEKQYKHSNNRNSESKKVLEYLIICERAE